MKGRPRRW